MTAPAGAHQRTRSSDRVRWQLRRAGALLMVATLGGAACGADERGVMCVTTARQALTNGVAAAQYLLLESWERDAILYLDVTLDGPPGMSQCSGVLIAGQWVLTAAHCLSGRAAVRTSVRLGIAQATPILEIAGSTWLLHTELDLALVRLDVEVPPSAAVPLRLAAALPASFGEGQLVQVAGYGFDEDGNQGTRTFLVERVVDIQTSEVRVSADGLAGACNGDSGGPLLIRGAEGNVEVLGVLGHGSASCYGADSYVRVDAAAAWIAEQTGGLAVSQPPEGSEHRALTDIGRCFGDVAVWREGVEARSQRCGAGDTCGFDPTAGGFRCIPAGSDPCMGITDIGDCLGAVTRRCVAGQVETQDCGLCGADCGFLPASGAASCVASPP